ncbi:MAG: ATP-binding protein [Acidobacteriia bacterium]|nr:ATP-binding protein [Terriglobia bacterium]
MRRAHGLPSRRPKDVVRGKVRAHDPFELIRWLAYSQPDPRKALAELVQNSLDAGAHRVRVTRVRERGRPCLRILDDGEGVIPDLARREALQYIATHIGHSRKCQLSPQERLTLMTQGQYGIGLLGFWCLGEMLEMRSAVPGDRPHRLILHRDRPDFVVEPLRSRLELNERWTEIVVAGLHRDALNALIGRRAADYLASELRGQLLSRDVELVVEDRMSRGRAQKIIPVRPPRFLGERVEGLARLDVPGHPPVRLEVYFSGGEEDGSEARGLAVYSAGTLVAESFHELSFLGLDRAPWTDARLTGLLDFPAFRVAPGSRRGVLADEAAGAFARALGTIEPLLTAALDSLERRRTAENDRLLIRDLQRAYRDFYKQRPRYEMLPVRSNDDRGAGPGGAGTGGAGGAVQEDGENDEHGPERAAARIPLGELLPAGPLDHARLTPSPVRVECSGRRRVRVHALDAAGRPVEEPAIFEWALTGDVGRLEHESTGRVVLHAAEREAEGRIEVKVRSGRTEAHADAEVVVVDEIRSTRSDEGIPEPDFVNEPGSGWRSRLVDGKWQVNTGHREYRAIEGRPALKLRYLAMLFAKEVVLRSSQDPRLERPLEQLVEVAAYADRNLNERKKKRRSVEEA